MGKARIIPTEMNRTGLMNNHLGRFGDSVISDSFILPPPVVERHGTKLVFSITVKARLSVK